MTSEKELNPDICIIKYGKRELKELTLYPLSIGDQFKVTDIVTGIVQDLVKGAQTGQLTDLVFMTAVMRALEENLGKVLSLVADVSADDTQGVIDRLTNPQLVDVVEVIWNVNYEPALKKGKNLFERAKSVFDLKRSSQNFSDSTLSTDLKMSTEKVIKTEDSPRPN